MNTNEQNERFDEDFAEPRIADYGDLAEKTAAGRTGANVDMDIRRGFPATFLSSAP
jgi:hypothetical protein